ncbi:MAG: hypothetical protein V8S71_05850, partial [Oscillospiraceae bacterium]
SSPVPAALDNGTKPPQSFKHRAEGLRGSEKMFLQGISWFYVLSVGVLLKVVTVEVCRFLV